MNALSTRALASLPIVEVAGRTARTTEFPLDPPATAAVSRGPDGAVRIGPLWSAGDTEVFQGTIEPGGSMAPHVGDRPLLVVMRGGHGQFEAPDGAPLVECGPGDVVLIEPGAEHGFRNVGDHPLAFVGVRPTAA